MRTSESAETAPNEPERRYRVVLALVAATWLLGLAGSITPLTAWPALFLYVVGGLALTLAHCRREQAWAAVGVSRLNLGKALIWGASVGAALMLMHLVGALFQPQDGPSPMAEMESMLTDPRLIALFPILVLSEEFIWRGMALSALRDRGWNMHLAVFITTLAYALNHFAVAPVSFTERGMLAMMAIPIGLIGGYLTWKLRIVWAAVIVHLFSFLSMVGMLFMVPAPVTP